MDEPNIPSDFIPADIDDLTQKAGGKFALSLGLGRRARQITRAERDGAAYGQVHSGQTRRGERSNHPVTRAMQELADDAIEIRLDGAWGSSKNRLTPPMVEDATAFYRKMGEVLDR